jgi:hypothetical protein
LIAVARAAAGVAGPSMPPPATVLVTAEVATGSDGRVRLSRNGQVSAGGPVAGGRLDRLTCDGVLKRVLVSTSGGVLNVGRAQRLATAAQRDALAVRDGGCVIPGCRAPASACQAHHVVHWSLGGPTDLANLALVCARHHDCVHSRIWDLRMLDGLPWARPPDWIDPRRRWLRNPRHTATRQVDDLAEQLRLPLHLDHPDADPGPDSGHGVSGRPEAAADPPDQAAA